MSAPLNLVNLERVHKAHGTTVILDDVSLGVAAGERIGVVGRNGGGKSTLLSMLTGADEPDSGRVTRRGVLAMGVLDQSGTLPPGTTVRDVVLPPSVFAAEHEWAGDPAVRSVLTGLELDRLGLDSLVATMSGGERRRVALPAQLIRPLDLLVLDEPTNHLDVEGVAWLAGYVKARAGGLVVVTHDRWFLDEVCTTTWEVADGQGHSYDGGDAAYTLARAERARIAAVTEERRLNLVRKELAWLRRGPPARTSKPRFRIEAAQALIADEPPARDSMALAGFAARRLGRTVYDVEDVDYAVPTDDGPRPLFRDLTWQVGPGDRIGIVGVNGGGRTALCRVRVGWAGGRGGGGGEGPSRGPGLPLPERHRAAARPARARGGAGDRPGRADRQPGDLRVLAGRAVRFPGLAAVDAGRRSVRRRAPAAAAAAAADERAQRAAARRADQRPGHRHPHGPGGPARQLRRDRAGGQPRPVLRRPCLRHRDRTPGRRHAGRAARRGGGVPVPARGRGGAGQPVGGTGDRRRRRVHRGSGRVHRGSGRTVRRRGAGGAQGGGRAGAPAGQADRRREEAARRDGGGRERLREGGRARRAVAETARREGPGGDRRGDRRGDRGGLSSLPQPGWPR